jgi:transcriptional regulator with XRE-family HTH domain
MAVPGPTTQRHTERLAGNLLRLARAQRGWSQRQLAEAAGVPVSTVARIESGTRQPSLVTISRLLAAADLELRARLEPYDDHDDVLDARRTVLTPEQRAQHAAAFEQTSQVLAEARRSATAAP